LLWKLPDAPLGDNYKSEEMEASQVQLFSHSICEQYDNYLYRTSNTFGLTEYYKELAEDLSRKFMNANDLVVDIGGNEGLILKYFMQLGFNVLLIDPSPAAREALLNGIEAINDYFSEELARSLMKVRKQKAKLVLINYTLANIPNLDDFFTGVSTILDDDGIVSIVTGYHPEQFQVNMVDYAGHDHLTYFSFEVLCSILKRHGLSAIDVRRLEHKGGSIQVLAKRDLFTHKISYRTTMLKQREQWIWPNNLIGIRALQTRVEDQKMKLKRKLEEISLNGDKIFGVGASISTSYLINLFEVQEYIDFLVDDDINKIGRFSPLHSIEVQPFSIIKHSKLNTAMILSWQHTNVLTKRLIESGFRGEVLVPLPDFRIIHL
jgi:hypothetical protein